MASRVTPDLNAGIDTARSSLLDPQPIFKQCGFYRDALLTGGKDYDNALWNYSVLGTTFMKNGDEIAHAISKGHPTYSEADTTKDATSLARLTERLIEELDIQAAPPLRALAASRARRARSSGK